MCYSHAGVRVGLLVNSGQWELRLRIPFHTHEVVSTQQSLFLSHLRFDDWLLFDVQH